MKERYVPRAQRDVADISDRLTRKISDRYAERIESALRRAVERLRLEPELGVDLGYEQTRRWPMREGYTIFYRIDWEKELIDVLRIVDSSRLQNLQKVPQW